MNFAFPFGLLFTFLLKVNQGCHNSVGAPTAGTMTTGTTTTTRSTVSYQDDAGLPDATSNSTASTTYNSFRSYGNNCGHNKYWNVGDSGFIVGGVEAYENEFPYLVNVKSFRNEQCSGVIINS